MMYTATTNQLSHPLSIVICFLFLSLGIQAQSLSLEERLAQVDQSNFYAVQAAVDAFYAENPTAKGQNQWQRKAWFVEPRVYPDGQFVNHNMKTFEAQTRYFRAHPENERSPHGGWIFIGPTNWVSAPVSGGNNGLGRINSIDFHPTNDLIIYASTASGGLWRTTNGGGPAGSWTNISPHIPMLAVADVEIDYTNPNIIYMLTGDGDPIPIDVATSHNQSGTTSMGILKSTDNGSTWSPTGFSFNNPSNVEPYKLLMHPTNPMIQYVAAQQGIFKTTNGWSSWTQEFFGVAFDIEFKPGDPTVMYMAGSSSIRKSTNSGDSWSLVSDPDFAAMNAASRVELAVSPNFPTVVYALAGNWNGGHQAFFQSLLDGINNSWLLKDSSANFGGFATYCIALEVKSNDYRDIMAAYSGFARNFNQGATGSWAGQNAGHADFHDIKYRNGVWYAAHDAGMYKSTNDGVSWSEISQGIACTEVYTVTGTPQNTNLYILGAQDVGHHKRPSATSTFTNIGCCDGMISLIDYTNQNTIYIAGQNGGINKSTTGLPPFTSTGNPGDGGAWVTPYIMDPVDPDILFVGKDSIHRTINASGSWQFIGSPSPGNMNVMAQGTSNRNRLYASSGGRIWRSDNALAAAASVAWTEVTAGLPNRFITGIAVNPNNSLEVFITMSGYTATQKVYKSTNGGSSSSWTNITGSLPNVPVNCIEYHDDGTANDAIYIGNDIGVFYRDNTIGDWIYYSNLLPSVSVSDLYINTSNNVIVAGTYGRGLWLSGLYGGCNTSLSLNGFLGPFGGTRYYSAGVDLTSSADYRKDLGTEIHYSAGNRIDLTDGFEAGGQAFFEGIIGPCPSPFNLPLNSPFVPSGKLIINDLEAIFAKESN